MLKCRENIFSRPFHDQYANVIKTSSKYFKCHNDIKKIFSQNIYKIYFFTNPKSSSKHLYKYLYDVLKYFLGIYKTFCLNVEKIFFLDLFMTNVKMALKDTKNILNVIKAFIKCKSNMFSTFFTY